MTATMTNAWLIRPETHTGTRTFRPVAVLADGTGVVSGPMVGNLATVAAARAWIARCYDGGRSFPKPRTYPAFDPAAELASKARIWGF